MRKAEAKYSKNHSEHTRIKRQLEDGIHTYTLSVPLIRSDAGSSGACTDNEETKSSFEHRSSTKATIFWLSCAKATGRYKDDISSHRFCSLPGTISNPSAQRRVFLLATNVSNLRRVAVIPFNKLKLSMKRHQKELQNP